MTKRALDSVEKTSELLTDVALHRAAVHDTVECVEGGAQGSSYAVR
jgi:hypothetical protein